MDDQLAQALRQRHKIGLVGHLDGARSGKRNHAVVDDAAGPRRHHANAVGQKTSLLEIVRDQKDSGPVGHPQILHDPPQLLAGELIERAERLVEHQELRLVDQRAAQRGTLHHAAGELPRIFVAEAGEPDLRKQRFDAVAEFALALGAILSAERRNDLERQHDVVEERQPWQQRRILERHPDAHRLGAHLAAGDIDVAGRRADQSGDELEDGRLAAARGPDKRDEIALLDPKRRLAERVDHPLAATVSMGHLFQLDKGVTVNALGWGGGSS